MIIYLTPSEMLAMKEVQKSFEMALKAEGIEGKEVLRSMLDDYKGISTGVHPTNGFYVEVNPEFFKDMVSVYGMSLLSFLKPVISFVTATERVGQALMEFDDKWTKDSEPEVPDFITAFMKKGGVF